MMIMKKVSARNHAQSEGTGRNVGICDAVHRQSSALLAHAMTNTLDREFSKQAVFYYY